MSFVDTYKGLISSKQSVKMTQSIPIHVIAEHVMTSMSAKEQIHLSTVCKDMYKMFRERNACDLLSLHIRQKFVSGHINLGCDDGKLSYTYVLGPMKSCQLWKSSLDEKKMSYRWDMLPFGSGDCFSHGPFKVVARLVIQRKSVEDEDIDYVVYAIKNFLGDKLIDYRVEVTTVQGFFH